MARVDCPKCGEPVKVRAGAERLRCPECGKSFRAPDEEEEDDEPPIRRPRRKPRRSGGGLKVALIAGGTVVGLTVLIALVVVLVRDGEGGGGGASRDPAKVTVENFTRVKPGMEPREVEALLGGGRGSSLHDMRDTLRANLTGIEGQIEAGFETAFAQQSAASEWHKWEGKRVRVWVAFAQTGQGKRAAFSTALEDTGGGYKRHSGFMTWAGNTDLDALAGLRKSEDAVRTDPKWVRGSRARALVVGEWRDAAANGLVFTADGKMKDVSLISFDRPGKEPTYRVEDDAHLETTKPSLFEPPPGAPAPPITFKPVVQRYEYLVTDEELALIEVTPQAHHAATALRTFYRMPAKPNGVAYNALLKPLLNDVRGTDVVRQQIALNKLERLGPGAAAALPELRELAKRGTNPNTRHFFDATINALSGGKG